jgi:hypothetical protein
VDRKHFEVFLISFYFGSSVDERLSRGGEKILHQKRAGGDEHRGVLPADNAIKALEQRPQVLEHLLCRLVAEV